VALDFRDERFFVVTAGLEAALALQNVVHNFLATTLERGL
jgi:hypothetical protein